MLRPGESDLKLRAIPRRPAGRWLGPVGVGDHLIIMPVLLRCFQTYWCCELRKVENQIVVLAKELPMAYIKSI